jgi:hypothetical protein
MNHRSGQSLDKVRNICKNPDRTAVGDKKQPVMYNDSKDGKTPEHIHPDSVQVNRTMSVIAHWLMSGFYFYFLQLTAPEE